MIAIFKLIIFVRNDHCVESRWASKTYPRHCIIPLILRLLIRVNLCYLQILTIGHPLEATGNRVNVPFILALNASNFAYTVRLFVTYDFHIKQPLFP
jgi:hypothetical protein